jgi:hypothetical protein
MRMKKLMTNKLFKYAISSLTGFVVYLEIIWLGPMFIFYVIMMYTEGDLTFMRTVYVGFLCGICGFLIGILGWYTVILPLKKSKM